MANITPLWTVSQARCRRLSPISKSGWDCQALHPTSPRRVVHLHARHLDWEGIRANQKHEGLLNADIQQALGVGEQVTAGCRCGMVPINKPTVDGEYQIKKGEKKRANVRQVVLNVWPGRMLDLSDLVKERTHLLALPAPAGQYFL